MTATNASHRSLTLLALAVGGALLPFAAHAYVGPGAGLSLLTALWGVVAAVGVALGFVLMWPIRRLLRRRASRRDAQGADVEHSALATAAEPATDKAQPQTAEAAPLARDATSSDVSTAELEALSRQVPPAARPGNAGVNARR